MNKVTEAKKAAEASLITRREETAAMRMQANTAKILEFNPTLMKLRELETLEKVADKANLTVVLGENGLADRVVKTAVTTTVPSVHLRHPEREHTGIEHRRVNGRRSRVVRARDPRGRPRALRRRGGRI